MGTKYASQTISGYNSSAPPDDGSTGSSNLLKWSNHKTKLADPIKTLAEDINSALVTALNFGSRTVAVDDTSAAADHMKTIECTASLTASLLDATTAGAGYVISYKNLGSGTVTIALQTSSDTLDGVAKWLFCNSKILIFDEPTRGIDVGTKYAVYKLIGLLAQEGMGVIVISSDLPEILGLTDRILVLHEGRLAATLTTAETTPDEVLNYAAGLGAPTGNGARISDQNLTQTRE